MKDYLSNKERGSIIAMLKIADRMEEFIEGNLFTKEEKSDLKRAITYMCKPIIGKIKDGKVEKEDNKGVLRRLNKSAINAFNRSVENSRVFISDKSEIDTYVQRRKAELTAAYEENKDYFKLVELILHENCKECNKCGSECPFYKEFEDKSIPEFDGTENLGNCKYSYREIK